MAKKKIKRMRVGGSMGAGADGGNSNDRTGHDSSGSGGGGSGGSHGPGGSMAASKTPGGMTGSSVSASGPSSGNAGAAPGFGPAGNATVADYNIAKQYIDTPAEKVPDMQHYWDAVSKLGPRYADYQDYGNSTLDNLGNLALGALGVGEMDPTGQPLGYSDNTDASWGFDPVSGLATAAGMVTGFPLGTLWNGVKKVTGYPGPQIALDGKQYMDYGFPSSPIAQGKGVYSDDGSTSTIGASAPSNIGKSNGSAGNNAGALAALAQHIASSNQAPTTSTPTPTPATDPNQFHAGTYNPYMDDYATYGQRAEHPFFMKRGGQVRDTYRDFGTEVEPQYRSIGGFLKKLAKKVAPALIGAGASALTGSDIIGGLTAAGTSKLFGNDWLTAGLTGLGTGLTTNLTGLSGDGPGLFDSAASDAMNAAGTAGNAGAAASSGFGGGILDFLKNNPTQVAGGALALAGALAQKKQSQGAAVDPANNPANDPAYADQIRNGGLDWGRTPTDTSKVDWYQYGQMPEFNFFDNADVFTPHKKKGGAITETPSLQPALGGALSEHGGQANGPGGGQDDKIPVYLSAKEYVVPADVVSDLGDGNPDEGAKKLDSMRNNVRKQKGRKGFPPKAKKTVENYL